MKSPVTHWRLVPLAVLVACGGGGVGAGGGDPAATVVGAAGGTVSGPGGAKVVIPPGALTADTTIGIAQTSAGAPALPGGASPSGPMFALTPHGTTFAVPVTVVMPFDRKLVPAGSTPALYKTDTQNQWGAVADASFSADAVTANVSSFSWFWAGELGVQRDVPERSWTFASSTANGLTVVGNGTQTGGVLNKHFDYAPHVFDIDGDGIASMEVFSDAAGVDFWASADAPPNGNIPRPETKVASAVNFDQNQSFIKREPHATLRFVITEATLQGVDFNGQVTPVECPWGYFGPPDSLAAAMAKPCDLMSASLRFEARAYHQSGNLLLDDEFEDVLNTSGNVSLKGRSGSWAFEVTHHPGALTRDSPVWTSDHFAFTQDVGGGSGGQHPQVRLKAPLTLDVDLSSVRVGQEFTVAASITATAYNRRGRESGIGAYLRDPNKVRGMAMNVTGLEVTHRPVRPVAQLGAPVACANGPGAAAGVLQFSAASYSLVEQPFAGMTGITVTRTQGSAGKVSVTVDAGGGTARPGEHYTPRTTTVFFGDGDTTPRTVPVDILLNATTEPDTTVNLTLSAPGGCATLGAQASAVLTIIDDDGAAPVGAFSLGGTVSGLAGSGLVLTQGGLDLAITDNGPFTFRLPVPTGLEYEVRVTTQPSNPRQVCNVSNGKGRMGTTSISNVVVSCVTPVLNDALDPSFGDLGKVTTPSTGESDAVALQADGKIVTVGAQFTLTRHGPDGRLDPSFGAGGTVKTDFGAASATGPMGAGAAADVAIQGDGKIVVVGTASKARFIGGKDDDFGLRRYNPDGSLDPGFGAGGIVSTDFGAGGDQARAVAIQPDGKIVVAGKAQSGSLSVFAAARYTADGGLDPGFGSGGKQTINVAGGHNDGRALVLQPDGGIVVAGGISLAGSNVIGTLALVRYRPDGALDESFGDRGRAIGTSSAPSTALAVQADGAILVAGTSGSSISAFGLTRYTKDGRLDLAFGSGGLVSTSFSSGGNGSSARAVAVQGDGKIVLVGSASSGGPLTSDMAIARYDAQGAPDATFGVGGKVLVDFFASTDGAQDVAIQPDGKIVVAGSARNGAFAQEFALARLDP